MAKGNRVMDMLSRNPFSLPAISHSILAASLSASSTNQGRPLFSLQACRALSEGRREVTMKE
jgi:hypothetical protein